MPPEVIVQTPDADASGTVAKTRTPLVTTPLPPGRGRGWVRLRTDIQPQSGRQHHP